MWLRSEEEGSRGTLGTKSGSKQTVGGFLEEWLTSIEFTMRPRSWQRYCQYVRLHAIPVIGHLKLTSLGVKDLQLLYAHKRREGLSPKSILDLHRTLNQALSQAQGWELLGANPAQRVKPPRAERPEIQPLSPEEADKLLRAARGDRLEALYVVAITTGMRQGELLGLRWRDVDLDRRSIRVTSSLQFLTGQGLVLSQPKTRKSRRHVQLTELAIESLRNHRKRQQAQRTSRGDRWEEADFVFTSRDGTPLYATEVSCRSLPNLLKKAGLRRIRFHDLRHTTATLLLGQGVHPKIVSEMLGHSNIAMTLDLYSHASPTMQETATLALDELLGGGANI